MKILIIGEHSSLASSFLDVIKEYNFDVITTQKRVKNASFLDLSQLPLELDKFKRHHFDIAIIFSALTNTASCENDKKLAMRINCDAPLTLIKNLNVEKWIVLSTNLVFSGQKAHAARFDHTQPFNVYGLTKQRLEQAARLECQNVAIVRMTKVMSAKLELWQQVVDKLSRGETVSLFQDMMFAPVSELQVSLFLKSLCLNFLPGIYQLSGKQDVSYFDFGQVLAQALELDPTLVLRARSTTKSPQYTSLLADIQEYNLDFMPPDVNSVVHALATELANCNKHFL